MDRQDRHQFVQQYVERQKPYLPTYTTEHLNERHGTPSKPLRSDEFGFDTPVLRPRVLEKAAQSQLMPPTGASESRTEPKQAAAPSEAQDTALGKKDKPRSTRKKASTPIDTDNERAARLADRRERKRKKRAIVNPPQNDMVPKKGRANGQKAKKPTALALLYGFSATNVTKDRLTLKPAPSLGVFNKGKASAKKKVTRTGKSSSRKEFFSESAFLNKPSERVADDSRIDDDSLASSISNHPMPRVIRTAKKDREKCTEAPAVETPTASTHTAAESEVWDIEVQSKLPSSARDVSSDPEAPVVLDLRGAEWRTKAGTRSQSGGRSVGCGSPPAPSDELGVSHAVDAPSIDPSHSASQIGRRDAQPPDLRLVTSKYFTGPEPATVHRGPQTSRSNDVLDSQIPGQDATSDVQTIQRADPSTNSLSSVAQPLVAFQTRYDMAPLEFPSDGDDWYARPDVPWEPLGGPDRGYFESSVVEIQGDRSISAAEYHHPHQSTTWDCHSADLTTDDVESVPMEAFQDPCDLFAREYEDDLGERESAVEPCFFDTQAEYDLAEGGQWFCMAETGQDFPTHEEMPIDGSMCGSEESADYGEPGFLEGRALLQDHWERPWCARLSGLVQAEMDVASQLRDHWRPLRL